MDRDDSLMDAIVQTSFEVMAALTRIGSAHDLSLTQLRVLAILRDRTPSMSRLAEHLGLDRSTISGLVDRSARRGLAERVADAEDRRSSRVALTADGRRLADQVAGEVAVEIARLTSPLSAVDRRSLDSLLGRIVAAEAGEGTPR